MLVSSALNAPAVAAAAAAAAAAVVGVGGSHACWTTNDTFCAFANNLLPSISDRRLAEKTEIGDQP